MSIPIPMSTSKPFLLPELVSATTYKPKALPLRYFPDPFLTRKCEPVTEITEEIKHLAYDMLLTMMQESGIGLAAPQVGRAIRMFVADVDWPEKKAESESYVFINPVVEVLGEHRVNSVEGCLSFPGERFDQKRSEHVRITALNLEGETVTIEAVGTLAVVIQHENDHLDGKTVGANLSWLKKDLLRKAVEKRLREQRRALKRQP